MTSCDQLLPLKCRFRDSQIAVITTFVVVSSVGNRGLSVLSNMHAHSVYSEVGTFNKSISTNNDV